MPSAVTPSAAGSRLTFSSKKKSPAGAGLFGVGSLRQRSGTISSATILMILISGLMAGPAVSL